MILTDGAHLVATESEEELHRFARRLGFKASWYQAHGRHPHYDLTTGRAAARAIRAGAKLVSRDVLVRSAWWRQRERWPV